MNVHGYRFPPIEQIEYHNNSVEKSARKLPPNTRNNLGRFYKELQEQVVLPGRRLKKIDDVWTARIGKKHRIGFVIEENNARILYIESHDESDRYLDRVRSGTNT